MYFAMNAFASGENKTLTQHHLKALRKVKKQQRVVLFAGLPLHTFCRRLSLRTKK